MIPAEGAIPATRFDLDRWMKTLPQPWTAAMEATVFTGWIYDHLQPHTAGLLMGAGVSYNKQKLHKVGYFRELLATNLDINEEMKSCVR